MAETLPWVDEQAAKDAIAAVRKDSDPLDWLIISYEGSSGTASQTLKLHASGTGGVAALAEALTDDIVGYCLVRDTDTVDSSVTVKFVFVFWLGDKAPRMQKARTSTHIGYMRKFIGQFHVDHNAEKHSELTPEIIKSKIMDFSGSGSRVLTDTGETNLSKQAATSNTGSQKVGRISAASGKSDQVTFADEDNIRQQMKEFRVGNGNDWIAFTYADVKSNEVSLLGTGSGGVAELSSHLTDDNVVYALVRKIDKIDESNTVKIAFVFWTGESTNRMLKARLGTHKGAVNTFFSPFHVDLNATQHNEVSDEIVLDLIMKASGTKVHVLDDAKAAANTAPNASRVPASASTSNSSYSSSSSASSSSAGAQRAKRASVNVGKPPASNTDTIELLFEDEAAARAALADVRNDSTETNWAILTYNAPSKSKTLKVLATGSGGFSEFVDHLQDDIVGYGLVRLTELIDQSTTTKFVWVNWVGDNINRMQRAMLATHKGFVSNLFSPFHVDHECNRKDEISEDILMGKIKKAAGTANFVR